MRFLSYFNVSVSLILDYNGKEPLSIYLKKYFATHKKHGSKDRKWISHFCYCYFRLGHTLKNTTVEERLRFAIIKCTKETPEGRILLEEAEILFAPQVALSYSELDIFPWTSELSEGIDHASLCRSFLIQPDLFIRLRPGHESAVKQKLEQASVVFREINSSCLAFDNASKIDTVIEINKEAVIQDYNSQKTGEYFQLPELLRNHRPRVWDCCCASGGKSILAYDILPPMDLTVSDIRKSILHNLKKRLKEAGINHYTSFTLDLTTDYTDTVFDLIIADLPCTGSGTWSRTPEELFFFEENKIEQFAGLQRDIISHLIPHLKKGGRLIYITCSVFQKENEDNVRFIESAFKLKIVKQKLLTGYEQRADSMFVAHFQL